MPTLTAPVAAKAAAAARGYVPPPEPKPPRQLSPKQREYLELQRLAREKIYTVMRECFPLAFTLPPVPLAIGIYHQITDVAGDEVDPVELSRFLRYWCTRRSYLIALWRGTGRRNLDGSVSGWPTVEQRNAAGRSVWGERYRPILELVASKGPATTGVEETEMAAA